MGLLLCCCVQTPLHFAAFHGRAEIVLMLLEHGADPTLENVCCVMCDVLGSCVLCGCAVFWEMWLCVICIFMDFVVLVGLLEFGANTNHTFHLVVCLMKIDCMNLLGSLDLMCDLNVFGMCSHVFCLDIWGVVFAHIVLWNVWI